MTDGQPQEANGQPANLANDTRAALLEHLSDGVYFVDRQRSITYWNRAAERITGFASDEVLGKRCRDSILEHCDDQGQILCGDRCPLLATMSDGQAREAHVFLHHKDGHRKPVRVTASPIRDDSGTIVGAVETFNEEPGLGYSRERLAKLLNASMIDPLTGVENRPSGEPLLDRWLAEYRQSGVAFGLIFADIDNYRQLKGAYGHDVGDDALKIVARTLTDNIRNDDHVIRWGGDEFLVMLAQAGALTLAKTAERFRMLVARSRLIADNRHIDLT